MLKGLLLFLVPQLFAANQNLSTRINSTPAAQSANTVNAGPASGTAAVPTFRSLVSADLPIVSASQAGALSTGSDTIAGAKTWNDVQTWKYSSGATTAGSYNTSGQWTIGPSAGISNNWHTSNGNLAFTVDGTTNGTNVGSIGTFGGFDIAANFLRGATGGVAPSSVANGYTRLVLTPLATGTATNNLLSLSANLTNTSTSGGGVNGTEVNFLQITGQNQWTIGSTASTDQTAILLENGTTGQQAAYIRTTNTSDASTPALIVGKGSTSQATTDLFIQFYTNNGNTANGQIVANGSNGAQFAAGSDRRLKTNIKAIPSSVAVNKIMALKPVIYDLKKGQKNVSGFIAQDMQGVFPEDVGEGKDGMLFIGGWSHQLAYIVAAMQAQQKEIEDLKTKCH